MRHWMRTMLLLAAALAAASACAQALIDTQAADQEVTLRQKLTVAYLFNIAKFVDWPDAAGEIRLCVTSNALPDSLLREIDGRTLAANKTLRVTRGFDQPGLCDLAFVSRKLDFIGSQSVYAKLNKTRTLTISDHSEALDMGFAVRLFVRGSRMNFAVDMPRIQSARFTVSSKLLRLADKGSSL